MSRILIIVAVVCLLTTPVSATKIDFSQDDGGVPLANGQHINSPEEFGNIVSISTSANTAGAVIFDSNPTGPNAASEDLDLLVNLGRILTIQSPFHTTQTVPGIFDTPNDTNLGGSIIFDFKSPQRLQSIDLIDIDSNNSATLRLTDTGGQNRFYSVPNGWTNDVRFAPLGWATLDLTTLEDQIGETNLATPASQDPGFNAGQVVQLEVSLSGSGALDNLVFVPEPSHSALAGVFGMMWLLGIRRRRS